MKTKLLSMIFGSAMLLCTTGAQAQFVASNGLKFDSNNYVFANLATTGGSFSIINSQGFPLDSSGNLLIDCAANCTSGTGIATVATLPAGKPAGTTYVVTDGSTGTDCTGGGGANFVFCRYSGTVWGTFSGGTAAAGGGANTIQFNNAAALGGVAQWTSNGTTTITGSATSILDLHAAGTGGLLLPGALSTGIVKVTTATGALSILTAPGGTIVGTSDAQALTNKDLTGAGNTFPTFNQTTTGSAAKWTTPRSLAGNSVDGSADVPFANKFIVQGTVDAGLSGAQFLGALGTGLVKNTTTTGLLSIAAASDVISLLQGLTGCNTATFVFTPQASDCVAPSGGGSGTVASGTVNGMAYYTGATTVGSTTPPSVNGLYFDVENVTASATVPPAHQLMGVPVVTPATPYTMLYSDRATYQRLTGGSTFTFNLGQITSNFASNMPFVIQNGNSGLLTLTANAADKIDNSATGGTSTLLSNFAGFVYQDNSSAPGNWWTLKVPTFAAYGSTCSNGSTWSTTTGFGCLSAAPVKSGDAAGGDLSGTYPNPGVAKINGTAFVGTNGNVVSFGAANIPADSGFLATNVVRKDTTNSGAAAMTLDMSASTTVNALKIPVGAGLTSGANGAIAYDSTSNNTHTRTNAADSLVVAEAAAIAANTIPKATDSTHSLQTASLLTDDGTTSTYTGTGGTKSPVFTGTGTTAGFWDFPQGTTSAAVAPCNVATSICFQAPTAVTSYLTTFPGAAPTIVSYKQTDTCASAACTESFHPTPIVLRVTADFTTAASTGLQAITGLSFTFPINSALNARVECDVLYHQNTAAVADNFGVQDVSVAPTNIEATSFTQTAATTWAEGSLLTLATTTATNFATFTPSAITTDWHSQLHLMVEQPSNAATSVLQLMTGQATAADTITIRRGSSCLVTFQ